LYGDRIGTTFSAPEQKTALYHKKSTENPLFGPKRHMRHEFSAKKHPLLGWRDSRQTQDTRFNHKFFMAGFLELKPKSQKSMVSQKIATVKKGENFSL
jgi:hypothetical protein